MSTAEAASPLTALVWVFGVSACVVAALMVSALGLAFRHRRRRKHGVYSEVLSNTPSSHISRVLTVRDILLDKSLHKKIGEEQIRRAQAAEFRNKP